jgi:hypothetical protein
VSGNLSLTSVGATSQLSATAGWPDGTTQNVTSDVRWRLADMSVATISSTGLVTAVAFGLTDLDASYGALSKTLQVVVTPAGTFVASGRVREPGMGSLGGVRVLEPQSGTSVLTDQNGHYSLGSLTSAHLNFEKEGYEPGQLDATPNGSNDLPLQRIVRIAAGDIVTPAKLVPHDLSYMIGTDRCHPCRLIRVVMPSAGTLQLHLTWNAPHSALNVWAGGRRFVGDNVQVIGAVPVSASEAVVYVGDLADPVDWPVAFTLTTLISPS